MSQRIYDNYVSQYGYAPEKPKYLIVFAKQCGMKIKFKEARQIMAANAKSAPKKQASKPISSIVTKEVIDTTPLNTQTKTNVTAIEIPTKMEINNVWPPIKPSFSIHSSQQKQFIAGPRTKLNATQITAIDVVLSKKNKDKKSISEPGQISQTTISTLDALLRKKRRKPKQTFTHSMQNNAVEDSKKSDDNFNNDPRFTKYNKMKKIGMPMKSIKMWMKADGFTDNDIAVWMGEPINDNIDNEEKEIQTSRIKMQNKKSKVGKNEIDYSKIAANHPFARYYKMQKVGLPLPSIKMWMKLDGCNERQIAKFAGEKYKHKKIGHLKQRVKALQNMLPLTMIGTSSKTFTSITRIKIKSSKGKKSKGSKASSISIRKKSKSKILDAKTKRFNRQIAKYNKMKEMGCPVESIKYRMKAAGLTPMQIAIWAGEPLPKINEKEMREMKEDGSERKYQKYHKMLKVKMPMQSIKNRMRIDGFTEQQIAIFAGEKLPKRKGGKSEKTTVSHDDEKKLEAMKLPSQAIMCRVNFECTDEKAKQEICDALKVFVKIQLGELSDENEEKESDEIAYYSGVLTYHFTCPDPINEALKLEFIELYQDEQVFWTHSRGKQFFTAFFKAFGNAKNRKSRIFITVGDQLSKYIKRTVATLDSTFPGSDAGFLLNENYLKVLDKANDSKVIFKWGIKSVNYCKIFEIMDRLAIDAKECDAVMFHIHRLNMKRCCDEFEMISIWPNVKCLERFLRNERVKQNIVMFKGLLVNKTNEKNDKTHFESELYSDNKMDDNLFVMINNMFNEIGKTKQLKTDIGYILHPKANSFELN